MKTFSVLWSSTGFGSELYLSESAKTVVRIHLFSAQNYFPLALMNLLFILVLTMQLSSITSYWWARRLEIVEPLLIHSIVCSNVLVSF